MTDVNDTIRDSSGNYQVSGGDFVFGDAKQELIKNILLAVPGHYKEFPTIGASVISYVNSNANKQVIARNIKVALKSDIFLKPTVDLSEFPSKIKVNNFEIELVQE
jgi:hypothetical protein